MARRTRSNTSSGVPWPSTSSTRTPCFR
jgi:hypothetical protein